MVATYVDNIEIYRFIFLSTVYTALLYCLPNIIWANHKTHGWRNYPGWKLLCSSYPSKLNPNWRAFVKMGLRTLIFLNFAIAIVLSWFMQFFNLNSVLISATYYDAVFCLQFFTYSLIVFMLLLSIAVRRNIMMANVTAILYLVVTVCITALAGHLYTNAFDDADPAKVPRNSIIHSYMITTWVLGVVLMISAVCAVGVMIFVALKFPSTQHEYNRMMAKYEATLERLEKLREFEYQKQQAYHVYIDQEAARLYAAGHPQPVALPPKYIMPSFRALDAEMERAEGLNETGVPERVVLETTTTTTTTKQKADMTLSDDIGSAAVDDDDDEEVRGIGRRDRGEQRLLAHEGKRAKRYSKYG